MSKISLFILFLVSSISLYARFDYNYKNRLNERHRYWSKDTVPKKYFDHFDDSTLNNDFQISSISDASWYNLKERKGYLSMKLLAANCTDKMGFPFVGIKQNKINAEISARLLFNALTDKEQAGLLIYQNENDYYYLCRSAQNSVPVIQLFKGSGADTTTKAILIAANSLRRINQAIILRITSDEHGYSFYYSLKNNKWLILASCLENKPVSTQDSAKQIYGMVAMHATANGEITKNRAYFDWFESK